LEFCLSVLCLTGIGEEMVRFYSRNVAIQILLSIPVVLLGVVAAYLIHRSYSGSGQLESYELGDGLATAELEQVGSVPYTSSQDRMQNHRDTETRRQEGYGKRERQQRNASPRLHAFSAADLARRLEEIKYDGYMQVGDAKLAWLSDGEGRIAVREGGAIDDDIRVEEMHENFLLVSAADGRIVHRIPFTQSSGGQDPGLPFPAIVAVGNTGGSSSATSARSGSVERRLKPATPGGSADGSTDIAFPPSTPSQHRQPPIPGRIPPSLKRGRDRVNGKIGAVIHIEPALRAVKSVGETFTVQVKIDNGSNIFAVPLNIEYDPGILEITSLHEGSYLKKDGSQTSFLTSVDRDRGKITVGLARLGHIGGVSGSGTLMSMAFKALRSGTALLSFADGKPVDSELNVLPAEFIRGEIRVK
jgi:hypothetical protein